MPNVLQVQNQKKKFETGDLAVLLKVKANAKVMIVTNIDLSDTIINDQIATVKYYLVLLLLLLLLLLLVVVSFSISIIRNEVNAMHVVFDNVYAEKIRKTGWFPSKGKTNQCTLISTKKHHQPLIELSFHLCYDGHVQFIKCKV